MISLSHTENIELLLSELHISNLKFQTIFKHYKLHNRIRKWRKKLKKSRWEKWDTGSGNTETEFKDDSAKITAETSFIGAIDSDNCWLVGVLGVLDHNDIVPWDSHHWEMVDLVENCSWEEHCRSSGGNCSGERLCEVWEEEERK